MSKYKKNNIHTLNKENIDYKDVDLLRKFINDQGKILSKRSTGLTTKQQKLITKFIKRARFLSLLPFLNKD